MDRERYTERERERERERDACVRAKIQIGSKREIDLCVKENEERERVTR